MNISMLQITIAGISVLLTFAGLNFGALQWILNRHDQARAENSRQIAESQVSIANVERQLLELKAELPLGYVRREDWIRISNTLEAKLDAMRAEMREEHQRLRAEVMGKITDLTQRSAANA